MDVTFGSVGDFISILLLVSEFIALLDDSRGSAWEYRALVEQLNVFAQVVDQARSFCVQHCDSLDLRGTRDTLEGIAKEARRRLEDVHSRINKYSTALAEGPSASVFKGVVRKVQWKLEKKETEKFRDDVLRYTGSIQSLLLAATARLMQSNHQVTQAFLQRAHDQVLDQFTTIEDQLKEIQEQMTTTQEILLGREVLITQLLKNTAKTANWVGMVAWKGATSLLWCGASVIQALLNTQNLLMVALERPPSMGPYFIFQDYMGVESVVSLNFINSWNAFEGSLRSKYKGLKGGRRVAQSRYLLQDGKSGKDVDRRLSWTAMVPGSKIEMSLICKLKEYEAETRTMRCPFCKVTCEGILGKLVKCTSCSQFFRQLEDFKNSQHDTTESGAQPTRSAASVAAQFEPSNRGAIDAGHNWDEASDSDEEDLDGLCRVAVLLVSHLDTRYIRLLDLEKNCLTRAPLTASYIALSYVWGGSDLKTVRANLQDLETPNGLIQYDHLLPLTVQNAIKWMRVQRHRFLWVDSLCIVQDDKDDWLEYSRLLHKIYNLAFQVLVTPPV